MTDPQLVTRWIDGYVEAWNSNRLDDITALFTEGAAYYPAPFSAPWRGHAGIATQWLGHGDTPGETAASPRTRPESSAISGWSG